MRTALTGARAQRRVGLGVVAAALVALTVVLANRGRPDEASMWISAISALVAVCAFAADLLREAADPETVADLRQRAADELAEAVRAQWTTEARLRRLQDPEPLSVRWVRGGPPLADHERNIRRGLPLPAPRDGDQRLDGIVETFRELPSGRLVVLGRPGAGKTVLAVQFVLGTLAARQPGGPVPVLFPLASWDPRSTPLRDWLAERLAAEYRPLAAVRGERTLARELLDAGLLLPVLDGFDEIPKPVHGDALRRLNSELDERLSVLLTCRTADWVHATHSHDVLTAAAVVRLRPLDLATARTYLESTARPENAAGSSAWSPVLDRPSAPLALVLTSPLMVALARTVYEDASRNPAELTDPERFPTAEHIERHLLDAFVPAAFADADAPWRPEAAHRWLRRLAHDLAPADSTGTWRLAWWELPTAMPTVLRVLGPALLAVLATASLLVPLVRFGNGVVADWDSTPSAVINFAGDLLGLCFGLAFLLPATAATPQGRRQLVRMGLKMTAAASVLAVAMGVLAPPLVGSRLGAVMTLRASWFFNGCCLGLVQSMMIAVAGLPRRPLPLGLPWAATASGPVAVRALGGGLVLAGIAVHGCTGEKVPAATCLLAGLVLCLAGLRRGERAAAAYTRPAAVLSGFWRGLLRGFFACTLIAVCAGAVVGCITGAFAAAEIHSAPPLPNGGVVGGWIPTKDGDERSVRSVGPKTALLVRRSGLEDPFVVMEGTLISKDETLRPVEGVMRIHHREDRWVVDCDGRLLTWHGEPVDAHNLVVVLPKPVKVWLVHRSVEAVVLDSVVPFVGFGLLIGTIGGCASGVYRALNTPSDTIRAAGPQSTLRTDRAATLARSAIAALLAGGVCLLLIPVTGRGNTLGTMHTEVWVTMGGFTLALSAWGRTGVARIWLALTGRAPWRLMGFLDEAHRRGVLRRYGAHYEFRHLRLQQRLGLAVPDTRAPRTDEVVPMRGGGPRTRVTGSCAP
ncbi:NACHT domain-containing protein [Streptomyces lincolnensis]|uniref:NACHT domain-containing protein n=1 Tax=Streptomyces lincolnensis TaxID=1915 RepID=UPI001E45F202|nr:NACHT domain-containing protein [Streptomyces lincolnensis]MCD7445327.1 NACHT domain-containing protein [Streptomyces lincolnensis]